MVCHPHLTGPSQDAQALPKNEVHQFIETMKKTLATQAQTIFPPCHRPGSFQETSASGYIDDGW
jgi:hypothetical protein